jgi:hypothetical protein
MPRYIFLDNWVFSLLRDPKASSRLTQLVRSNGLTVLITSLSMTELYNPGWEKGGEDERGASAMRFLARVPCAIVNPQKIWEMEAAANLTRVQSLPLELDLADLPENQREVTLLRFLRRDELFLKQGHDIKVQSLEYMEAKRTWLQDVENIIENACANGYLKRDESGRFRDLAETKEFFLFSLDLRHADLGAVDAILKEMLRSKRAGNPSCLTSVRLCSLCYWYHYVDVDNANQPKRSGSDIGDFYHISLLPYCVAFTSDGTMYRTLSRIREPVVPVSCKLMTKRLFEEWLQQYA